jgi:hypothetical protein
MKIIMNEEAMREWKQKANAEEGAWKRNDLITFPAN